MVRFHWSGSSAVVRIWLFPINLTVMLSTNLGTWSPIVTSYSTTGFYMGWMGTGCFCSFMLRMYEKIFLHFSFIVKWKNVFKDRVVVVRMYECMKMYEDLFPYHRIIFFFRVRFFYHTSSYIPTFVFVIRIYFFLYEECMKNSSYSLFVSLFVRKNRLFPSFFSCQKHRCWCYFESKFNSKINFG